MGTNGIVDLKITDYYNGLAIITNNDQDNEKGYLTESEIDKSRFVNQIEMLYHKDKTYSLNYAR